MRNWCLAITVIALLAGACSDDDGSIKFEENGQFDNLGNAESPNVDGEVEEEDREPSPYADVDKLDLLYVADNSGSMCQEQAEMRNRFRDFIRPLLEQGLDLQIGITTTHMVDSYQPEPVAKPGEIQSTPQPIPGFDPSCRYGVDANGEIDRTNFKPVRELLALAAECAGVDPSTVEYTDEELRCYFDRTPGCQETEIFEQFEFPEFPKIIRSSDYRLEDGSVDLEQMHDDFQCASLVGTRGYGIEKGLEAATLAVSPEKTGYAPSLPAADPTAPNHGLIRADSRFALVFLTDENDCSHDGTLDEATSCGGDICEFALDLPASESPLIPVASVQRDLLENLSDTKGRIVAEDEVTVLSFHGGVTPPPEVSNFDSLPNFCSSADYSPPELACVSFLGQIRNGSRYGEFAGQFTHTYPAAEAGIVPGAMCDPEFGRIFDESYRALLR